MRMRDRGRIYVDDILVFLCFLVLGWLAYDALKIDDPEPSPWQQTVYEHPDPYKEEP